MANFWDSIGGAKPQSQSNNFNLQGFLKFAQEMKGKDPNVVLQQMIQSGQVTQDQVNNVKQQAQGIEQMLKTLGIRL